MRKKTVKIVERKLGREKAHGQFTESDKLIEIDPRLNPQKYLETLIHELLHFLYPDFSETKVTNDSKFITKQIWNKNYRRLM